MVGRARRADPGGGPAKCAPVPVLGRPKQAVQDLKHRVRPQPLLVGVEEGRELRALRMREPSASIDQSAIMCAGTAPCHAYRCAGTACGSLFRDHPCKQVFYSLVALTGVWTHCSKL